MRTSESNVLVLGAGGYIGSVLARHFGAHGLDVGMRGDPVYFDGTSDMRALSSSSMLRHGVTTVINSAAFAFETSTSSRYLDASGREHNVRALRGVLDRAATAGIDTWVQLSTMAVYGESPRAHVETDPYAPTTDYARTKALAERLVAAHVHIPRRIVLRLGTVFGLSQRLRWTSFIEDCLLQARSDGEIRLRSSGRQRRSVLYLGTLAEAVRLLLLSLPAGYHVLNLSDGTVTVRAWARYVARYYGVPLIVGTGGDAGRVVDSSRFWKLAGRQLRPHRLGRAELEMTV